MLRRLLVMLGAMLSTSLLALIFAGFAFAEGSWTSYLSGVLPDFESRIWTDHNSDSVSTVITFKVCRTDLGFGPPLPVKVNLRRIIDYWPDDSKGTKTLSCYVSGSGNWGDLQAGKYRFKIGTIWADVTYPIRLDAQTVKVTY